MNNENKVDYNKEVIEKIKEETMSHPVPDSLSPDNIEEKLKNTKVKSKYSATKILGVLAACFLGVLVIGTVGRMIIGSNSINQTIAPTKLADSSDSSEHVNSKYAKSYEDISDIINTTNKHYGQEMDDEANGITFNSDSNVIERGAEIQEKASDDATNDVGKLSGSQSRYSETDTQVKGVMEGDIVKTDGTYIYTIGESPTGACINIHSAKDGKTERLARIMLDDIYCDEIHIKDNKLVVIGSRMKERKDQNKNKTRFDYIVPSYETIIDVYDISDITSPKLVKEHVQDGTFRTTRLVGNYLYTYTSYETFSYDCVPDNPEEFVPSIDGDLIKPEKVLLVGSTPSHSYSVVTSLDISGAEHFSDKIALLGSFNTYYMGTENIYLIMRENRSTVKRRTSGSSITKYSYKDGEFNFEADTVVDGMINSPYYMHEYNGNFIYVYTTTGDRRGTSNGLCVMDKKLKLQGFINNLGVTETIYSSYYIDNIAYFVTYRNTDPVFAVDIKDAKNPKLLSELKLPGFSNYLHNFGKNMLLGIGESDNSNIKLSLFDIAPNGGVKEKLTKEFKDTYWSASENHKAIFVDEERMLIGMATDNSTDINPSSQNGVWYTVFNYKDGKLNTLHADRLEKSYDVKDVRGIRIGEYFYVVDVNNSDEIISYKL
ncbi:MAG: beta-propeller domain-containing protein [Eubacterium sp.]|nr:beta-propeller domain-containing protein [Eubacterium sp.]